MFQTNINTQPILMNTGFTNVSDYVPVVTITNNPPTMTYAGGKPLYQPLGSLTPFPTNATFSSINTSSITTSTINVTDSLTLDGNILTTNSGGGGELLLNGIPIATTSNISSISDWSLYSAVSSINCVTNDIVNVGNVVGKTGTGGMNLNNVGTLTFDTAGQGAIVNLSTINGAPYVPGGSVTTNTITGTATFDVADGGLLAVTPTIATITAQNGLYGKVNVTANPGIGGNSGGNVSITANGGSGTSGLWGQIDLTANSGSGSGITSGGKINIVANSGSADAGNLTSAVNINGAGITSQAGYTTPILSVAGYNFIGGNSGVNICGGFPSIIPNIPGTTYLYGTLGVEIGSDTYLTRVFPYQYGLVNAEDILISGRSLDVGLGPHTAYVNLSTCKSIGFGGPYDVGNIGQINGLSTINGAPYVPGGGSSGVASLNGLTGALSLTSTDIIIAPVGTSIALNIPSIPYTLSGTKAGAVIVNAPIGSGNPFPSNTYTLVSQITFNIPPGWNPTDSVYYDGWILADFDANFNSYWGVSYYTNTNPTPTDLIGSTTTPANSLNYSNIQQIYLAINLTIPPTNLTAGGTITLNIYCNPTSNNHYLTILPVNQARIGIVTD